MRLYGRIPFKVYPAVPDWAHVHYCKRSRAASVIQHFFRTRRDVDTLTDAPTGAPENGHTDAERRRAARIISKFMLKYTDAWRVLH